MPIPKPSETKQPILGHLAKMGGSVKISHITESMGQHFNLSKQEIEEEMPTAGKRRFATKIGIAVDEMKAAGLVQSTRRGFVEITPKGRTGLQEGTVTKKKPGRAPKAEAPTNGRERGRPGRPPKVQSVSTNGRRKPGRPKAQVKAPTNGRRKPGRPKMQPVTQPSITPIKQDDKMVQRTTDIFMSYIEKNTVSADQVPGMLESIYTALSGLGTSSKLGGKGK